MSPGIALFTLLAIYGLVAGVYLISENRRPQATLAWLLAFFLAPGLGVVVYFLFGRDRKAFAGERRLHRQVLEPAALPLLSSVLSRQDAELARLVG